MSVQHLVHVIWFLAVFIVFPLHSMDDGSFSSDGELSPRSAHLEADQNELFKILEADNAEDALKEFFRVHPDFNANFAGNLGLTPLNVAARKHGSRVLRLLLKHGAQRDQGDNNERLPIHDAARHGNVEAINVLATNNTINAQSSITQTPLQVAVSSKASDAAIELLLEKGALPTREDRNGNTAMLAAAAQANSSIMHALWLHGCPTNVVNSFAKSPLSVVAGELADTAGAQIWLIDHGALQDLKKMPNEYIRFVPMNSVLYPIIMFDLKSAQNLLNDTISKPVLKRAFVIAACYGRKDLINYLFNAKLPDGSSKFLSLLLSLQQYGRLDFLAGLAHSNLKDELLRALDLFSIAKKVSGSDNETSDEIETMYYLIKIASQLQDKSLMKALKDRFESSWLSKTFSTPSPKLRASLGTRIPTKMELILNLLATLPPDEDVSEEDETPELRRSGSDDDFGSGLDLTGFDKSTIAARLAAFSGGGSLT